MSEVERRTQSLGSAVGLVLTAMLFVPGCATETKQSAAGEAKPAVEEATKPTPPAVPVQPQAVPAGAPEFWQDMPQLAEFHGYKAGLRWRLTAAGIELEDAKIEGHAVNADVIRTVWSSYGTIIEKWSAHYDVPIEVILTAVCVESKGNSRAKGGKNIGLMQILVPTAQAVLNDPSITEESLYDPDTNIEAGTAYIARQKDSTLFDPPKVAAAYNAGSLRSADNRWGMKQYGPHLDKTVVWFNAALAFMSSESDVPEISFAEYFRRHP